uniref:Uncharacterized protein n=1 Tax=Calcidiscus leptoporus TaxID=127549 RepID=A0A7S0J372_9EUKA
MVTVVSAAAAHAHTRGHARVRNRAAHVHALAMARTTRKSAISRSARMSAMSAAPTAAPALIVNGLPGAMGVEIARACLRRGLPLAPFALTGPGQPAAVAIDGGQGGPPVNVQLYSPERQEELAARIRDAYGARGDRRRAHYAALFHGSAVLEDRREGRHLGEARTKVRQVVSAAWFSIQILFRAAASHL